MGELERLKVPELKQRCRDAGILNAAKMKKAELIQALRQSGASQGGAPRGLLGVASSSQRFLPNPVSSALGLSQRGPAGAAVSAAHDVLSSPGGGSFAGYAAPGLSPDQPHSSPSSLGAHSSAGGRASIGTVNPTGTLPWPARERGEPGAAGALGAALGAAPGAVPGAQQPRGARPPRGSGATDVIELDDSSDESSAGRAACSQASLRAQPARLQVLKEEPPSSMPAIGGHGTYEERAGAGVLGGRRAERLERPAVRALPGSLARDTIVDASVVPTGLDDIDDRTSASDVEEAAAWRSGRPGVDPGGSGSRFSSSPAVAGGGNLLGGSASDERRRSRRSSGARSSFGLSDGAVGAAGSQREVSGNEVSGNEVSAKSMSAKPGSAECRRSMGSSPEHPAEVGLGERGTAQDGPRSSQTTRQNSFRVNTFSQQLVHSQPPGDHLLEAAVHVGSAGGESGTVSAVEVGISDESELGADAGAASDCGGGGVQGDTASRQLVAIGSHIMRVGAGAGDPQVAGPTQQRRAVLDLALNHGDGATVRCGGQLRFTEVDQSGWVRIRKKVTSEEGRSAVFAIEDGCCPAAIEVGACDGVKSVGADGDISRGASGFLASGDGVTHGVTHGVVGGKAVTHGAGQSSGQPKRGKTFRKQRLREYTGPALACRETATSAYGAGGSVGAERRAPKQRAAFLQLLDDPAGHPSGQLFGGDDSGPPGHGGSSDRAASKSSRALGGEAEFAEPHPPKRRRRKSDLDFLGPSVSTPDATALAVRRLGGGEAFGEGPEGPARRTAAFIDPRAPVRDVVRHMQQNIADFF